MYLRRQRLHNTLTFSITSTGNRRKTQHNRPSVASKSIIPGAIRLIGFSLAILAGATSTSHAQNATPASAEPPKSKLPSVVTDPSTINTNPTSGTLETLVVTDVPLSQTTLPVVPSVSVYGLDQTVQETPRAVSQITPAQLKTDVISNYNDFARYAPAVTQAGTRLTPSSPTIRGQTSAVYRNGFNKVTLGAGFPFQFNAYEGADIIAGPASVIFGPTASSSGYVNYTTKAPYFDDYHGSVNYTFGKFVSGGQGSHPENNWQFDVGGPLIKDKLAFRLSYQQQLNDSYFTDVHSDFQDIYGALSWIANKDVTFDWNFNFSNYDYTQWNGASRVNQELIDDNTYVAGRATPIIASTASPTGFYSPNSDFSGFVARTNPRQGQFVATNTSVNPGTTTGRVVGWVLNPENANKTKLYAYEGTSNPNDYAYAQNFTTEFKGTFQVSDKFKVINTSYYEYLRNTFSSRDSNYLYAEVNVFENRTESIFKDDYELFGIKIDHQSNSGVDLRFEQVKNRTFQTVYASPYDLTQDQSSQSLNAIYGAQVTPSPTGIVNTQFGRLNLGTSVRVQEDGTLITLPNQLNSENQQVGLYTQHNFKFNDQWGFNVGGRATIISAHSEYANPSSTVPGADDALHVLPAVNASVTYQPAKWVNLYTTYVFQEAVNGGSTGLFSLTNDRLASAQFHSETFLYEGGAKFEIIPNKLFATATGYYQQRALPPNIALGTPSSKIEVRGFDLTTNYQPTKNLSLGANYSFMEANYIELNSRGQNYFDSQGFTADGTTAFQDSGAFGPSGVGNYRVSAMPRHNFNFFGTYQFDFGLGFNANLWAQSSQQYQIVLPYQIPAQYGLNLGVFYQRPNWRAQIDFLNVTDQRNWQSDIREAAAFLLQSEPFAVQGKVSFTF